MRSKFLAFFRENPLLLLLPAALAMVILFWNPSKRVILGRDPHSWFHAQSEIHARFEDARYGDTTIRLTSDGSWEIVILPEIGYSGRYPVVVGYPKKGVGTWRISGDTLILGDQLNELGNPTNLSGSRLRMDWYNLRLELPNGTVHSLTPKK